MYLEYIQERRLVTIDTVTTADVMCPSLSTNEILEVIRMCMKISLKTRLT